MKVQLIMMKNGVINHCDVTFTLYDFGNAKLNVSLNKSDQ